MSVKYRFSEYIDTGDGKAWAITGRRATDDEIKQMVDVGDITQAQVDRKYNPIFKYNVSEYTVKKSTASKKKFYFPQSTHDLTKKDIDAWFEAYNPKRMTKIGGINIGDPQKEIMDFVGKIHARNAENLGFDPSKYKLIWADSKKSGAYADSWIMPDTIVQGRVGGGRIKFYPQVNLGETILAQASKSADNMDTLKGRLFKTTIHESLHWIDWCLNDHLDAFINLEMATMEKYGYRVLSYGRFTEKENGRYISQFMNMRTGKIYQTDWAPDLYIDKKAYETALKKYEKDSKEYFKNNPNAPKYAYESNKPMLSKISYNDRITDGNKTLSVHVNSKVGGKKGTMKFSEPNFDNTANPWAPIKTEKPIIPKGSAIKKVAVKKAIQTSASTQAWSFARNHGTEIKRRAILAFQFGKNVGMDDGQLLNHIRKNLDKYTANPNNLGGNVVANSSINNGRMKAFKHYAERLTGYEYNAILDSRTTETCQYLHGKTMIVKDGDVPEYAPPNHFGCRSILIPITITDKQPDKWTGFEFDKVYKAQAEGKSIKIGKKVLDPNKIIKQKNL